MRYGIFATLTLMGAPAFAAGGGFSLANTDLVVTISFVLFIAVLAYLGVHKIIGKMLDDRADGIQNDLDEAKALREEAQSLLASYERKQREVKEQAEAIVTRAREDAKAAGVQAKEDIKASIARRMQVADDQIKSAQASAVREVRETAVSVAIGAASDVIAKNMKAADTGSLIDAAIADVDARLN